MSGACDVMGMVFRDGTCCLMARIEGWTDTPIVPGDVALIEYTIWLLDENAPNWRQPVQGQTAVALSPAAVLFAALQTGAGWTVDAVGYNFLHVPDVSASPAFQFAGRQYLIEYRLTPVDGQPFLVRFRVKAI